MTDPCSSLSYTTESLFLSFGSCLEMSGRHRKSRKRPHVPRQPRQDPHSDSPPSSPAHKRRSRSDEKACSCCQGVPIDGVNPRFIISCKRRCTICSRCFGRVAALRGSRPTIKCPCCEEYTQKYKSVTFKLDVLNRPFQSVR